MQKVTGSLGGGVDTKYVKTADGSDGSNLFGHFGVCR